MRIRKLRTLSATWTTVQVGEHTLTICVARDSAAPAKGYDVWLAPAFGQLGGEFCCKVPHAPTEMQMALWAQTLAQGGRIG